MVEGLSFEVSEKAGSLTIKSPFFSKQDSEDWVVMPFDDERLMVQTSRSRQNMGDTQDLEGAAKCSINTFYGMMIGLSARHWSGVVSIDTGFGVNKLYLDSGKLCFGASGIIDHRLGEVLYRNGLISLDELTDSAVKVTRSLKFGQVLLSGNIMNPVGLWEALKLQVLEILRFSFLAPDVYVELKAGRNLAPTGVVFEGSTEQLLDEAYSFGQMFRQFVGRIHGDSKVVVQQSNELVSKFKPGTFVGDLLQLITESSQVSSVVEKSKLLNLNTYVAIMSLVHSGICEVASIEEGGIQSGSTAVQGLKSQLDAYSVLIRSARQAFSKENVTFPLNNVKDFVHRLNSKGFVSLYLNEDGDIHPESVLSLYSQCYESGARSEYFADRIDALIQFLLQIVGDLLPYETAKSVKADFRMLRP